jgi:hypothetical protein
VKARRAATWAAGALAVVVAATGTGAWLLRDPAVDLSDMEPPPWDVKPEEDAFGPLTAVAVAKDVDGVRGALARKSLQIPESDFDADLPWLFAWAMLETKANQRAKKTLDDGDPERAVEQELEVVELGRRIVLARGATFTLLHFGRSTEENACHILRLAAIAGGVKRETLVRAIAALDQAREPDEAFEDAWKVELKMVERMINDVRRGRRTPESLGVEGELGWRFRVGWTFRPNATLALFAPRYRLGAQAAHMRVSIDAKFEAPPKDALLSHELRERNAVGKAIFSRHEPNVTRILERRCQNDLALDATRVALALRGFKDENGALPSKLDELVPRWLPSVPCDPYDGQPLRWSRDRQELWSVCSSPWTTVEGDIIRPLEGMFPMMMR